MRDCDREAMERLEGHNPLGWKPHGRDAEGNALLRTVLQGAVNPETGVRAQRECFIKITPQGLYYDEIVHGGPTRRD